MSFLSDLFEGKFSSLGTDLEHAPSSLAAHPEQIAEVAGALALPFLAPEIGGALGLGDVLGLGGDLAGSAASDALAGAADVGAEAVPAGVADASLLGLGGQLVGGDALAFAPTAADAAAPLADLGAAAAAPGTTAGLTAAGEAAAPAAAESVIAPSEILSADPSIAATLDLPADTSTVGAEALSGPTSSEFAAAGDVGSDASALGPAAVHTADVPAGAAAGDTSGIVPAALSNPAGSEIAASSQVPGLAAAVEGGPSSAAIVDAAQAGGAAAAAQPGLLSSLGGGLSSVGSTLGSVASNPLAQMAIPGSFLAYQLLKGPPGIPPQAQQALDTAGQALPGLQKEATANLPLLQSTAAEDLKLADAFQVSPAQAAQLEIQRQNAYNALYQQIASQNPGSDPHQSSQWILGKQQIDQQILAQQTQMIDQLISTAFQAQSAAQAAVSTSGSLQSQYDTLLMQAAQLQVQQDQQFSAAVGSALQSFGLIAGLSASKLAKAA